MTDAALSTAQAALSKSIEALTQVQMHEKECARRYQEAATAMGLVHAKLDTLLEQQHIQRGKSDQNRVLLGGIPNALWASIIGACVAGAAILGGLLTAKH